MKNRLLYILLALALVMSLTVFAAPAVFAAEETTEPAAHSHCVCVNSQAKPADHICDETIVWEPWDGTATLEDGGHYYLTKNVAKAVTIKDKTVSICLNGFNLFAGKPLVIQGGTFNLCNCTDNTAACIYSNRGTNATGTVVELKNSTDNRGYFNLYSGRISGATRTAAKPDGNRLVWVNGAYFNMYGGELINGSTGAVETDTLNVGLGGAVYLKSVSTKKGEFKMYGGTISGGQAVTGGNIYVDGAIFEMHGGIITNGKATGTPSEENVNPGNGGNIFVTSVSTVNGTVKIAGGTIENGQAVNGGNIATNGDNGKAVNLTVSAGLIQAGQASELGGNVYNGGTTNGTIFKLTGGTISNGSAKNGGNIAMAGAQSLTLSGGSVENGAASENGGNFYTMSMVRNDKASNNTFTLTGTAVSGGTAGKQVETVTNEETQETTEVISYTGNGGSIYVDANGTLNVDGSTISGGHASDGGNIYVVKGGELYVKSGKVADGQGIAGGNIYTAGHLYINGGSIENGKTAGAGGNIRLNDTSAQLHMEAGTVSGGQANNHGGNIYALNVSQFFITGGEIKDGIATGGFGGNIYATNSNIVKTRRVQLKNVTISGGQSIFGLNSENKNGGGTGGNVDLRKYGQVTIENANFSGGLTKDGGGDNLYLSENNRVNITDSTFTVAYGGRVNTPSSTTAEENKYLYELYGRNYVSTAPHWTKGNGGNICIASSGDYIETKTNAETNETTVVEQIEGYVNITNCQIIGGLSEKGGALYAKSADVTLDGITAKSCGGSVGKVIFVDNGANVTLKNSTIVNWGTAGSAIANSGSLTLEGNINMPKEYNAVEMITGEYKVTNEVLTQSGATTDISGLISVDADEVAQENISSADGVIRLGHYNTTNDEGTPMNAEGKLATGINDTNRPLVTVHNTGFVGTEREGALFQENAAIQGINASGNIACGGKDLAELSANYNTAAVYYTVNTDITDAGELTVSILLNLNGKKVSGATVAEDVVLQLADTASVFTDANSCGSFAGTVDGTLERIVHCEIADTTRHFVILQNQDGSYSAHRYQAYISHVSLDPSCAGLGFTATFQGDEVVRQHVKSIGYNMWVNDLSPKSYMKAPTDFTSNKYTMRLLVRNILTEGNDAQNQIGAAATVNGEAVILFDIDGQEIAATTSPKRTTLKSFVQSLNKKIADGAEYTVAQITGIQTMIQKFSAYMEGWNYDAIMAWTAPSTEPAVPEGTEAA